MKTTVAELDDNKVKLSIEVDEQEFEKAINAAFRKIAREVNIPGFRAGKAPRRLLEARLGEGVARGQALNDAIPDYYAQAVRENDVDVIASPEIDITGGEEEGPVAFDAVVEVRPVVQVPGYESLRITIANPVASDEEIDAQVDRMRAQFAELNTVEREAAEGDFVTIDIEGSQDDEPLPGLTATDYSYEVGSSGIVPELDEALVGVSAGDEIEFDADHPDPEEDGLHFAVTVKEVKERVLPEATDDWASEASEFDTLDELRDDLGKRMTTVRRMQAQLSLRDKAGEALAELVDLEVPEALITNTMQQQLQDVAMRLQAQNTTIDEWLERTGQDQQSFVNGLREGATVAAKVDLALRAVAEAEGLEATDDDLNAEYAQVAERLQMKAKDVRRQFEQADQVDAIKADIKLRKAMDFVANAVEIVDEEGHVIDRADLEMTDDDEEVADEVIDEIAEEIVETVDELAEGEPEAVDPGTVNDPTSESADETPEDQA